MSTTLAENQMRIFRVANYAEAKNLSAALGIPRKKMRYAADDKDLIGICMAGLPTHFFFLHHDVSEAAIALFRRACP